MITVRKLDALRALGNGKQEHVYTIPADGELRCIPCQTGECTLSVKEGQLTGEWLVHRGQAEQPASWVIQSMDTLVKHKQANAPLNVDPLKITGDGKLWVYLRGQTAPVQLVVVQ